MKDNSRSEKVIIRFILCKLKLKVNFISTNGSKRFHFWAHYLNLWSQILQYSSFHFFTDLPHFKFLRAWLFVRKNLPRWPEPSSDWWPTTGPSSESSTWTSSTTTSYSKSPMNDEKSNEKKIAFWISTIF